MRKGQKMTPEQCEKISVGRKLHATLDLPDCQCILHSGRLNHQGRKRTEETKENISKALEGRKLSEEHKENISKSKKQ